MANYSKEEIDKRFSKVETEMEKHNDKLTDHMLEQAKINGSIESYQKANFNSIQKVETEQNTIRKQNWGILGGILLVLITALITLLSK